MNLRSIDTDAIGISPLNVRKHDVNGIKELAASIESVGLLQPIIVRPVGDQYEVIAGQRRFLAMKHIGHRSVPALVTQDSSDLTSLEVSLAENFMRAELDPIEACEAFMAIKNTSETLTATDLANRFGVSPLYVTKCLALAGLPDDVRKYARKKGIDLDVLKALTVLSPTQLKAWKKAHAAGESWAEHENAIVRSAVGDKPKVGDNVFDLAEYTGTFTTDLFGDRSWFDDVKLFAELQAAELERHAEKLRAEGWSWVQTFADPFKRPSIYEYGKSKNKKIAGAIVYVAFEHTEAGRKTLLKIETGLLDPEQVKKIERDKKKAKAEEAEATQDESASEPEGGAKPLSNIMVRVHEHLARMLNAHTLKATKDPVDLLHAICDLMSDGTLVPNVPKVQPDVPPIVQVEGEPTPGTVALKAKMTQTERFRTLRAILASCVTHRDFSKLKHEDSIRALWTPGPDYFGKLDKERLAVCAEEIGYADLAANLRSGKTKRSNAVIVLTNTFAGEDGTVAIRKAAASWVPKEFREAQAMREYEEAGE